MTDIKLYAIDWIGCATYTSYIEATSVDEAVAKALKDPRSRGLLEEADVTLEWDVVGCEEADLDKIL